MRPDAVARARVLSTLKALKDLGCTNTMTVTHVFSTVKQITFQVKGVPAEAKKKAEDAADCGRRTGGFGVLAAAHVAASVFLGRPCSAVRDHLRRCHVRCGSCGGG